MKRIFINRVLAFLLIGATLTYAGCKDYDDDIGNVQTELSETAAALQIYMRPAKRRGWKSARLAPRAIRMALRIFISGI